MQMNPLAEASSFNEILANMAMHLSNPFLAESEELQALGVQVNIYINDLTFVLNQYHRDITEVKHHLPDLESCDIKHLSTALRIWNRVIGGKYISHWNAIEVHLQNGFALIHHAMAEYSADGFANQLLTPRNEIENALVKYAEVTAEMKKYRVAAGTAAHRLIVDESFYEEFQAHQGLERVKEQLNKRTGDSRRGSNADLRGEPMMRRTTFC